MLKKITTAASVIALCALTACGSGSGGTGTGNGSSGGDTITMGFAQVGAESGWRTANTKSIQDEAKAAGIDLKF
ncbi:LacI family transcriptional regulator, partial [Lentzea rhizosphaerae]